MYSRLSTPGRRFRAAAARICRELILLVVLPSTLLLGAKGIAQPSDAAALQQDNRLAAEINSRLMASNSLRPLDLGVWVHHGAATLTGTVASPALRQQAEDFVRAIPGVKAVDDRIAVGVLSATAPGFAHAPGSRQNKPAAAAAAAIAQPQNQSQPQYQSQAKPAYAAPSQPAPPRAYSAAGPPLLTLPAGTPIAVMMLQKIDSRHTQPGTGFRAVVAQNVFLRPRVIAIPRGARVLGTIIDARPPGHLKGRPQLALQLSNVEVGNTSYVLTSNVWARRGPGKGAETAQAVTGTAAMGAITGAIVGGGPVALLGAAVGALGGAGLSALSPGARLVVPAESIVTFHLNAPLTVREPTFNQVREVASNLPFTGYRRRYRSGAPPPAPLPPPIPGAPPGGYPY